jgi:hypothetical protein
VLPLAGRVGEAEVDVFDFLFFDQLQDLFDVGHIAIPVLSLCERKMLGEGLLILRA